MLGASAAQSATLPPGINQELIDDFSGGLDTVDPSHKVAKGFSPYMRNVFIDNGRIERISGYQTLGSSRTLSKVTGIFPFVRETGQTTFLVTDSSVTLETSDFKNWTFVSSGSNTGALLSWIQVRNKMWGFNGVDFIKTWDSTILTTLNGLNGTPNVPKFRYGAYYLDRVFGFGIPSGASDLYYSAVVTTDNIIIAPDNQFAWPTSNATYVGRGDGTIGTALWIYQGLLRAGKEQSIYTIYGDNPSNFKPVKEEAGVGVASNESVRVMDGDTHFLGPTGIYRNVERVSDLIEPDIELVNKGPSSIVSNIWETPADFLRGQMYGSSTTLDGFLYSGQGEKIKNTTGGAVFPHPIPGTSALAAGTTFYGPIRLDFRGQWAGNEKLYLKSITVGGSGISCIAGDGRLKTIIYNSLTGAEHSVTQTIPGSGGTTIMFSSQAPTFDGYEVNQASFIIKFEHTNAASAGQINIGIDNTWIYKLQDSATSQFLSDVATETSVTAWGNFDSVRNTNGGAINYFIRSSTSVINITTKTWSSIGPGAIISEPLINNFVQWAATFTSVFPSSPSIDNVVISHIEGQATDARAFAMDWQNRYWLTVTTTSNSAQRLTYVKSIQTNKNPNAWMAIEGYPINCYAKTVNALYAGSASTGAVYRLDYGTNFDGMAISSIYDTPDMPLGDYFFDKMVMKYFIDGVKSDGSVMTVQSSFSQGPFTSSTFSITGSGRYSHIVEGIVKPAKTLRLRLLNAELDAQFGINNINVLYEPRPSYSNK